MTKLIRRSGTAIGLLALTLAVDLRVLGDDLPSLKSKIEAAWQARENEIRSFTFDWTETRVYPKNSRLDSKTKGPAPDRDIRFTVPGVAFRFDGKRCLYTTELVQEFDDLDRRSPMRYTTFFTGTSNRSFLLGLDEFPRGSFAEGDVYADFRNGNIAAILWNLRPIEMLKLYGVSLDQARLRREQVRIGEVDCLLLEWQDVESADRLNTLCVAPSQEFAIRRYSQAYRGNEIAGLSIEAGADPTRVWCPTAWSLTITLHPTGDVYETTTARVDRHAINVEIPISDLEVEFPPKTYIQGSGEDRYVVMEDGQWRQLTKDEIDRHVPIDELLKPGAGSSRGGVWEAFKKVGAGAWIVIAGALGAAAVYVRAVRRARTSR